MENKKTITVKFPLFAPKSLDDWLTRPSLDEDEAVTLYDIYQQTLSEVEGRNPVRAIKKTFWAYIDYTCRKENLSGEEIVAVKEAVKKALSGEEPTEETEDKIVEVSTQVEGSDILTVTITLTDKTSKEEGEPYHPTAKKLLVKILRKLVSELRWGGDNQKC